MNAQPANPITPAGYAALKARYDHLLGTERPRIVEIVSWAAGNGDRSENGDYLYGRKRMREIDRELAHLARRMKAARVIDPAGQPDQSRVFFGATVTIADEEDARRTVTIVGDDEQDASADRQVQPRHPAADRGAVKLERQDGVVPRNLVDMGHGVLRHLWRRHGAR